MSSANDEASPTPRRAAAKPKKKAPGHFKAGGTSLVAGLLAGADQVAERSFLGGANRESEAPARSAPAAPSASPPVLSPALPPAKPASVPSQPGETAAAAPTVAGTKAPGPATGPVDAAVAGSGESRKARRTALPAEAPSAAASAPPAAPKAETRKSAPEPKAEAASAPEHARRDVSSAGEEASAQRSRPRPGKPWAHEAVHESFANAKIRSETWTSYGFRLDPEVLADLKERLKSDRRTSGNTMLGQGHYLDAALRHIPEDVDSQIEMAQAFLDDRMGVVEAGKQSTYRVGPLAHALVSTLNQGLQEADYGRRGLYVVSAALESLLQALDAEGELQRPERRTKVQRPTSS